MSDIYVSMQENKNFWMNLLCNEGNKKLKEHFSFSGKKIY